MSLIGESSEDEIVISGISGRYPQSRSLDEFAAHLYSGTDMVTTDASRWPPGIFGLPERKGVVLDIDRFDADFFGLPVPEADTLDIGLRLAVETTYEAIVDAGLSPAELRGQAVGVFVGLALVDRDFTCDRLAPNRAATTVTHHFNLRGPAVDIDSACASSLSALHEAALYLRTGRCSAALVVGINMALRVFVAKQFHLMNMTGDDGRCKVWDARANGYARSEGVVSILLQRSADRPRRQYASIANIRTNCDGYTEMGITFPSSVAQQDLMRETYDEIGLDPLEVKYMEAHGTGTLAGDPEEANAIAAVMCPRDPSTGRPIRREPLLVGAVKSNMGHPEAVSGLCAISKVLLTLERQLIPADLNFESPHPNVIPLVEGLFQNVTRPTPLPPCDYVGMNSFGFGGVNVHIILKSHQDDQRVPLTVEGVPRLILACGRSPRSVERIFHGIRTDPSRSNAEFLAILSEFSKSPSTPNGMRTRGYVMVDEMMNSVPVQGAEHVQEVPARGTRRPLVFLFTGMGCQWSGMGSDLERLEPVCRSIAESGNILKPLGIDLDHLIHGDYLQRPVGSFVAIAAVQIAFLDLLAAVGLPVTAADHFLGHSIGELLCAYADGTLTRRETLLIAYWRGKILEESLNGNQGAMAAVGLSATEMSARCPPGVVVACDNAPDMVKISGPHHQVTDLVTELETENIFARLVDSSGVPFHNPDQLAKIRDKMIVKLNEILLSDSTDQPGRRRSSKWITTLVPQSGWSTYPATSAEYLVDNLINPVHFREALAELPSGSCVLEISPHALFQGIICGQGGPSIGYVPLMKRDTKWGVASLLKAVGQLYCEGYNPDVSPLYPAVSFPVARGTGNLSSLLAVGWEHSRSHFTPLYPDYFNPTGTDMRSYFDLSGSRDAYLAGHAIDGRILFPATGYLYLALCAMSKVYHRRWTECPAILEDVTLERATIIPSASDGIEFVTRYDQATGRFEIREHGLAVATGRIWPADIHHQSSRHERFLRHQEMLTDQRYQLRSVTGESVEDVILQRSEVYRELRVRGYDYGPSFQRVSWATADGRRAAIEPQSMGSNLSDGHPDKEGDQEDSCPATWITMTDSMLQISVLGGKLRGLILPTRFKRIAVDPAKFFDALKRQSTDPADRGGEDRVTLPVVNDLNTVVGVAPGMEIEGLKGTITARRPPPTPILESYQFVANFETSVPIPSDLDQKLATYSELIERLLTRSDNERSALDPELEQEIEQFISNNDQSVVLKAIYDRYMSGSPSYQIHNVMPSDLETDLFASPSRSEPLLRPAVDLIIENSTSGRPRLLELNTGCSTPLTVDIKPLIANATCGSNQEWSCTVAVSQINGSPGIESQHADLHQIVSNWSEADGKLPSGCSDEMDLIVLFGNSISRILGSAGSELYPNRQIMRQIHDALKAGGFLLTVIRSHLTVAEDKSLSQLTKATLSPTAVLKQWKSQLISAAESAGLTLIGDRCDTVGNNLLIMRKPREATSGLEWNPILVSDETSFEWVTQLKSVLYGNNNATPVWLIADKSSSSGLVGLVNCLRREPGGDRIRCIIGHIPNDVRSELIRQILAADLTINVIQQSGETRVVLGTFRHLNLPSRVEPVQRQCAFMNVAAKGDLTSFRWFQSDLEHKRPDSADQEQYQIQVAYSALNFKDVMLATGRLPADCLPYEQSMMECLIGFEFSGYQMTSGRRMMGLVSYKGLATRIDAADTAEFLLPLPTGWTLEEGATVMAAYGTAYYALVVRGRLHPGESVLIHSAAGGVGQAAIAVCLAMGCRLFITVGSEEKRRYLKDKFPGRLTDNCFASSRSTAFERHVMRQTKGRGVDVVLNSLADEKLIAGLRCLAPSGRFLELGKYDLAMDRQMDTSLLDGGRSFHGILLDSLLDPVALKTSEGIKYARELSLLIRQGIRDGVVRPLDRIVFPVDRVEDAFRYMAAGKHTGKVLLQIQPQNATSIDRSQNGDIGLSSEFDHEPMPPPAVVQTIPRAYFHPDRVYIILGGLGGFGLEVTRFLIDRGARQVVLTSRSGISTGYQRYTINQLTADGQVSIVVSRLNAADLDEARKLIQLATEDLKVPLGGIFNLAMVLRDGLFENQTEGQFQEVTAAKIATTMNMDRLSRELFPNLEYFVCFSSLACGRGNAGQTNYGLANSAMERLCESRRRDGLHGLAIQWGAIGDVGVVAELMGGNQTAIGGSLPQRIPSCIAVLDRLLTERQHSVVSSLVPATNLDNGPGSGSGGKDLLHQIGHIMGIKDLATLNKSATLAELGLDSLMAVEVKQTLERECDLSLSLADLRALSIGRIRELNDGGGTATAVGQTVKSDGHEVPEVPTLDLPEMCDTIPVRLDQCKETPTRRPVFILPPVEGTFALLDGVIRALTSSDPAQQRPLWGLRWTVDMNATIKSVSDVTSRYVETILELSPDERDPVDLIGYSMGAVYAFEVALELQRRGRPVGSLLLLDGSPTAVEQFTGAMDNKRVYVGDEFPVDLVLKSVSDTVGRHLVADVAETVTKIKNEIEPLKTSSERIQSATRNVWTKIGSVLESSGHSVANLEFALEQYCLKMWICRQYQVGDRKLITLGESGSGSGTRVTLIRAQDGWITPELGSGTVGDRLDYGLSSALTSVDNERSTPHLELKQLPGNHQSFLQLPDNQPIICKIIQNIFI